MVSLSCLDVTTHPVENRSFVGCQYYPSDVQPLPEFATWNDQGW